MCKGHKEVDCKGKGKAGQQDEHFGLKAGKSEMSETGAKIDDTFPHIFVFVGYFCFNGSLILK